MQLRLEIGLPADFALLIHLLVGHPQLGVSPVGRAYGRRGVSRFAIITKSNLRPDDWRFGYGFGPVVEHVDVDRR